MCGRLAASCKGSDAGATAQSRFIEDLARAVVKKKHTLR
jgi:hypothetical protein